MFVRLRKAARAGVDSLYNPEKGLKRIAQTSFEEMVGDYLTLLLWTALGAGVVSLLFSLGRTLYLELFFAVDVQHLRMLNYLVGQSMTLAFFYLFAGTFILVFLALGLSAMIRKHKLVNLMKIILFSATPLVLFGWIPFVAPALLVWSGFLLVISLKSPEKKAKAASIDQRD